MLRRGVEVDAPSDDIAARVGVTDLAALAKSQLAEDLGFVSVRVVSADSVVFGGEGSGFGGVAVSVKPASGESARLVDLAHRIRRLFGQRGRLDLAEQ